MTGTENSPTGTLEEHLRLGAGFAAADRPRILEALSALAPHLSGWEHDQVDPVSYTHLTLPTTPYV